MKLVVLDFETSGLSPDTAEILEIGAVVWENGTVSESFHALVKPAAPIPPDISQLTGLDAQALADAEPLAEVLPRFLQFISGHPLAGHHVSFDLDFLRAACGHYGYELPVSVDALDTQRLARILLPTQRGLRLEDLAAAFGIATTSFHRALSDAQTTAHVLTALRSAAEALPVLTLQQLERLSAMFSPLLASWFNEVVDRRLAYAGTALPDHCESIQQLVFSSPSAAHDGDSVPATEPLLTDADVLESSQQLLAADSPLRAVMDGFQARPGQQRMVQAVAKALETDQHLLVEAGTGTGKSLAYLIPAALYARKYDTRVVVSTHTIALQDQIRDRDFPMLQRVVGGSLSLAVLKGRTHYVCMRKLWQEVHNIDFGTPRDEVEAYMGYLVWLVTTPEGNREELPMRGRSVEVWTRIQSESETCIGKRCPFFKPCYYFRARAAAHSADIVVTNHALVFSDLKADHRVLPKYDKLIFDEAHHLEEAATMHLGESVNSAHLLVLLGRLARDNSRRGVLPELTERLVGSTARSVKLIGLLAELSDHVRTLRTAVEDAFAALAELLPGGSAEYRIERNTASHPAWTKYEDCLAQMENLRQPLVEALATLQDAAELETDTDLSGRLFDAHGFLQELLTHIETLQNAGQVSDDWVVWIERTGYGHHQQISLHRAPIDVADILRERLFGTERTVILTSATLAVNDDFTAIQARLGLDEAHADGRLASLTVPSPFDFRRQSLLCVPSDVPDVAKMNPSDAAVWLSDSLYQLAKVSEGRLLALFTSHALLRATAQALRHPLRQLGLQTLAQGVDGNRSHLLDAFRRHPRSVLLGAQSFWEGIDLPGDQLVTLVIVRLPFAPPTHPVTEARNERLEKQGLSAFWTASLPDAVVRFRQGFGRLIRTVQDRGVVVVYDKRLITAKYGTSFIRSIPGVSPLVAPEREMVAQIHAF
ncbi:MAG: DEAD/DEAH box helicase family protein, partial [Alicyclobacillus sp.]|nr:DEAD/DEAH box helicase family protein [Alicyclobacillus sp.]